MDFHTNTASLHLSLRNYDLNLDLVLEPSSSSSSSPPRRSSGDQPRVFSCNYCQRKFYSSQALGGHQNAHRLERTLAKKSRELSSVVKPRAAHERKDQAMASYELNSYGCGTTTYGSSNISSWSVGERSIHEEMDMNLDLSLRL